MYVGRMRPADKVSRRTVRSQGCVVGVMSVEFFPESVAVSCFPDGTEPPAVVPLHATRAPRGCRWATEGDVAPEIKNGELVVSPTLKRPFFIVVKVSSVFCGRVHGQVYGTAGVNYLVSHPGWLSRRTGIVYSLQRPKDSVPYLTKDTNLVFRVYDVCVTGLSLEDGQTIPEEVILFVRSSKYFSTASLNTVSNIDWRGIRDRESARR